MTTLEPHEWLKDKRVERGLTQPQVEARTAELGARITQGHLSKIENGNRPISTLGPERMEALRKALSVSPEEWSAQTGLRIVAPIAEDPPGFPEPLYEVSDEIYMPEALKEAIDRFGDDPEYAGLRDPDTQREMALARGFRGGPQTAGEWLSYFIDNKRWLTKKDN